MSVSSSYSKGPDLRPFSCRSPQSMTCLSCFCLCSWICRPCGELTHHVHPNPFSVGVIHTQRTAIFPSPKTPKHALMPAEFKLRALSQCWANSYMFKLHHPQALNPTLIPACPTQLPRLHISASSTVKATLDPTRILEDCSTRSVSSKLV